MADQQDRARVVVQQLLQQVERFDIEVVGRLVQHQQIAFARHQLGQQQPRLFPPDSARTGARACRSSNRKSLR